MSHLMLVKSRWPTSGSTAEDIGQSMTSRCTMSKTEVGKRFARISSEAVWKGYGKLAVKQAADELRSNQKVARTLARNLQLKVDQDCV